MKRLSIFVVSVLHEDSFKHPPVPCQIKDFASKRAFPKNHKVQGGSEECLSLFSESFLPALKNEPGACPRHRIMERFGFFYLTALVCHVKRCCFLCKNAELLHSKLESAPGVPNFHRKKHISEARVLLIDLEVKIEF